MAITLQECCSEIARWFSLPGSVSNARRLSGRVMAPFHLSVLFFPSRCQVDDNVTRHLDNVLKREDWDVLILHYLGLDHIGHLSGPNSPLVGPKLSEMDKIIQKIHTSLLSKVKCMVLGGDLIVRIQIVYRRTF